MHFNSQLSTKCFSAFLILFLSLRSKGVRVLSNQVRVFSDNSTLKFNKLAVHYDGAVFIGAVNRLYQLSCDLELLANITTGPLYTNSSFTSHGYDANKNYKLMDDHNKILLIFGYKNLISCGTLQFCNIYYLNATISESNAIKLFEPVVTNSSSASTVAFIGEAYQKNDFEMIHPLWIAQSHDHFSESFEIPVLAVRDASTLKLIDNSNKIAFNINYYDKYVNYIYGFQSEGNKNYILTTQKNSAAETPPHISKLIRICSSGPEGNDLMNRYAEIPVECIVEKERPYSSIQAAFVISAAENLETINISKRDTILLAIFSQNQDINSQKASNRSALCMYSLEAIDQKFHENILNCFNGNENAGLEFQFTSSERQCIKRNITTDYLYSCPSDMNMSVSGNMPMKMISSLTFDAHLTAIAVRLGFDSLHIEMFLGTDTGHLKRIIVENTTNACEYDDITVDEQSSVNSDLFFDSEKNHLFVMTERKLTKVSLGKPHLNCSEFTTRDDCVRSNNVRNYWCSDIDECTVTKCGCNIRIKYWKFVYEVIKSDNFSIQPYDPEYLQSKISGPLRLSSDSRLFAIILPLLIEFVHCRIAIENNITFITNDTSFSEIDNTLHCNLPTSLLEVPFSRHNLNVTVSVIITKKNLPFIWSTNITIYGCNMYTSCFECVDSMFPCFWEMNEQKCIFKNTAKTKIIHSNQSTHKCLPTFVSSFWPKRGPHEGRTAITIWGKNLGYSFNDLNYTIEVSGIPCTPSEDQFKPGKKIVCIIDEINIISHRENREGPIEIMIDRVLVKSKENFTFTNPAIHLIDPLSGSSSGGTILRIEGENLDAGRSVSVQLGDLPCFILTLNSNKIECITSSNHKKLEDLINVTIDGAVRVGEATFRYINNHMHDDDGFNVKPKSIPAGGIAIKITLQNSPDPENVYIIQCKNHSSYYNDSCEMHHNYTICKSPYIPDVSSDLINANDTVSLPCLFMQTSGSNSNNGTEIKSVCMTLYSNPKFHNFSIKFVEYTGSEFISIRGINIDRACQIMDVHVEAGNQSCRIFAFSTNEIICILNRLKSISSLYRDDFDRVHEQLENIEYITVSIGEHFKEIVPKAYTSTNNSSTMLFIYTILTASIVIAIFIILWKIYSKYSRTMREMQRRVNKMSMDAISMRQCIKQVIIENRIDVDGNVADILNLPNVTIKVASFERYTTQMTTKIKYLLPQDAKWEFPRCNLSLGKRLGEGEFGKVVQGEAVGVLEENVTTTVAVKMLKDTHSDSDMIDLVSEMEIMKLIGTHENVLRLLGCCTENGPLFIITEFAQCGNLLDFLRKHHPFIANRITSETLDEQTLLTFALQVARGMEYLVSRKCIHRDLAARNILVSDNFVLKIADFGLARNIQNKEYYRKKTNGRLPVKWLAPEALTHLLFTAQSDVWSYGILLWEILTLGGVPYPTFTDMDKLIKDLESGYRMEQPSNCSLETYNLMRRCWHYLPEERPTFSSISDELCERLSCQGLVECASEDSRDCSSCSDTENEVKNLLP